MALFQRQYALAAAPPPLSQPRFSPPGLLYGIHVTYVEFYRKAIKPGEIEPRFLIQPRMSY